MNITVVGTGYVGLVAGLGFAEFGNTVVCLDTDTQIVDMLQKGRCPIYEPGVDYLLERNIRVGRISFTSDTPKAIKHGEIIFIAVGTPENENGDADLNHVLQAAIEIGRHIEQYTVVVDKSTVPVGTARQVKEIIRRELEKREADIPFDVASNPEFLREGKAVNDFLNPDRIVIGTENSLAEEKLKKAYAIFERSYKPVVCTSLETAEMVKYAVNSFLATKIAFINEIAELCESVGANVLEVAKAMGMDGRISPKFLHPGPGFGGSCFPKDIKALAFLGRQNNSPVTIVESVIKSNQRQKVLSAQKITQAMSKGGVIAILGLSFKPETDDVRESSSIEIVKMLIHQGGYLLRLYDPQAMKKAKMAIEKDLDGQADNIIWCSSVTDALSGAQAVAVVTEWLEFRSLDFNEYSCIKYVFDFRNIYNISEINTSKIQYYGKGIGGWKH